MADNNNNRTTTSTQIRNMYSEGMSYLNMKFFNTNLCFQFYPFLSRDNVGRNTYDMKNGLSTTVNFAGAHGLWQVANDIIEGKIKEITHDIPCASGANLVLQCRTAPNGEPEVIFSISKNNITIPFKFNVVTRTIKNGAGQTEIYYIQNELGAFMDTIKGYLNGINADRHLDKLTDDFVKSLGDQAQQGQNQQQQNGGQNFNNRGNNNFRGNNFNNNYKKPNYNNNGYKRQYNNNGNNNGGWQPPQQQNLSSYEIKN